MEEWGSIGSLNQWRDVKRAIAEAALRTQVPAKAAVGRIGFARATSRMVGEILYARIKVGVT
jgi:hypothetical protein